MFNDFVIPIVTCFDNNYAAPASVCFYSLLENANKNYEYKIYVLHDNINENNKEKLRKTIKDFSNASIEFINMSNKYTNLFNIIKNKCYYSKEIFYKFSIQNLFPQYDKIIVTDVDVVFLGDISEKFTKIDLSESYIGAFKTFMLKDSMCCKFLELYKDKYSESEQKAIQYAGGYYIYNAKKMREDDLENKFINFAISNKNRIIQPEQDTINIVCYPFIKDLKANALVCTYVYDMYKSEEDFSNDLNYSAEEIKNALNNQIQRHSASPVKPWNNVNCSKNEIFFKYLLKTPFLNNVLISMVNCNILKLKLFKKHNILKIRNNKYYLFNIIKVGNVEDI